MNQNIAWPAKKVRQTFFEFFSKKNHQIVPSAPIVLKDDPTLMFTNAGMNQFKDYFLGNAKVETPRVADSQKCLRVSGKHNDLEEVGHDTYHHTMFEMLGNWSFGEPGKPMGTEEGSYFKKQAIAYAWELLTKVFELPKHRLYATVFEGDASEDLEKDSDAEQEWKNWIAEDHILYGNKKDNFWEMGASGPCGPSSELHIDLRSEEERKKVDGATLVNMDHPQVVEIWNLVFIEFNRKADGSLEKLKAQHVDTGMGFERLCMALQGKQSNYDTDVFTPLIGAIANIAGHTYGKEDEKDIAMRVIADHVRAVAFAIADGQLPSNAGAGYVIRRILRRAIRYGFSYLNTSEAFIYKLVAVLAAEMGEAFPEIKSQQELVTRVIQEEENSFLRTLGTGLTRLDQMIEERKGATTLDGARVFELYDTFGFPPDLTALILREKGLDFDAEAYEEEMRKQKERARGASKIDAGDWVILSEDDQEEFIGYDHTTAKVKIKRYRTVKAKGKEIHQLVFNLTPFYPEGGGQVGDTGFIKSEQEQINITNTIKEHGLVIHFAEKLPENMELDFEAVVDDKKRLVTSYNHTATHLLHQALREVLGSHVEQKGSLVNADYLRFDFSHFSKVTAEEIEQIETLVNERIRADFALEEFRNIPIDEAKEMGAMALFGEKYGDTVRAIKFGDSIELCGGIHVQSTGQIGVFKIVSEGAVAAGIRRIEAVSGKAALAYYNEHLSTLEHIKQELKNPKDVVSSLQSLRDENAKLKKQVEALMLEKANATKKEWKASVQTHNGVNLLTVKTELPPDAVKNMLFQLKAEVEHFAAVVGVEGGAKVQLAVALSDSLVKDKALNAGALVKELAKEIKGGGGGQPFFAMAGGTDASGLDRALTKAKDLIK